MPESLVRLQVDLGFYSPGPPLCLLEGLCARSAAPLPPAPSSRSPNARAASNRCLNPWIARTPSDAAARVSLLEKSKRFPLDGGEVRTKVT